MALLILACAVEIPLDTEQMNVSNVITGDVVFAGTSAPGPAALLLFPADDPPPPVGTGAPVDFSMVAADSFTGPVAGIQAAPYSITGVPDGSWLVTGLIDADHDFQPLYSATAGATCGDWLGAHLSDIETETVGVITVADGDLADDVTVVVGSQLTTERPAFFLEDTSVDQAATGASFRLGATDVHSEIVDLTGPFAGDPCDTAFWFYAPDADGDGAPDPHPNPDLAALGLIDVWPKVYLRYLDPVEGESWASEAVVSPFTLAAAELGVPTPMTELTVLFIPGAEHTLADGTVETVYAPDLPKGAWDVTVVQLTGQTWTVPNELPLFPTTGGWSAASQGVPLTVE